MKVPKIWGKWVGWLFILHKSQRETKIIFHFPHSQNSDNSASSLRFLASHHAYIRGTLDVCLSHQSCGLRLWGASSWFTDHFPSLSHLTLWHFKVGSQLFSISLSVSLSLSLSISTGQKATQQGRGRVCGKKKKRKKKHWSAALLCLLMTLTIALSLSAV